jgi:hypothetical protein
MLQNSLSRTIPCYLLAFLSLFFEVKLDNFPARQSSKSSLWISSRLEYIFLQASFKNAQQFYIICLLSCCMNVHSEIQSMLGILFVCVCVWLAAGCPQSCSHIPGGQADVDILVLDLQSLQSVRKCATDFKSRNLPLHLLVNVPSCIFCKLIISATSRSWSWPASAAAALIMMQNSSSACMHGYCQESNVDLRSFLRV